MAVRFSEEWLNKVRDASDIVDVVSAYVPLTVKGRRYWGICPFHNEKTPSFSVSPEKQMFYCFGCHEGGNVFSFVSKIEKLNFMEAVKLLADRANIPVEDIDSKEYAARQAQAERLYELNKLAARFYYEQLAESPQAQSYLKKRGLDKQIIAKFGLGFAPDARDALITHAREHGFSLEELILAGLAVSRGQAADMFRNRLMFPIINQYGRVIAFGGRVLDDSKPKYLNSPDTPVFNKRRNLFGINIAKKSRNEGLILVEGYMDAITLHQFGYDYTVASLGTALTAEQAALMRRYANNIYIVYDGDSAGQNATLKALEIIRVSGAIPRVVVLSDMDPDEFLRQKGKSAFNLLMENASNEMDYKLALLQSKFDLSTPQGKKSYAIKAAQLLQILQDPVEAEDYARKIAAQTGFSQDAIIRQAGRTGGDAPAKKALVEERDVAVSSYEWHIIRILIANPKLISSVDTGVFSDNSCKEVYNYLVSREKEGKTTGIQDILNEFSNSENSKDINAMLFADGFYKEPEKYLEDCIRKININKLKVERRRLAEEASALIMSDPKKSLEILEKIKDLDIKIANCEKV